MTTLLGCFEFSTIFSCYFWRRVSPNIKSVLCCVVREKTSRGHCLHLDHQTLASARIHVPEESHGGVPSQQAAGFSPITGKTSIDGNCLISKSRQVATLSFLPRGKTGLEALLIPTSSLKQMGNTWHWSLLMDPQLLLRSTFPVNVLTSHLALAGKQPSFVSYLRAPLPTSWCLPTKNLDNNG